MLYPTELRAQGIIIQQVIAGINKLNLRVTILITAEMSIDNIFLQSCSSVKARSHSKTNSKQKAHSGKFRAHFTPIRTILQED